MARTNMPATPKEWFDYALFYCSKRETSRSRLKSYLIRKMKGFKPAEDKIEAALEHIEFAVSECERLKVVDDERYAGMLTREYARRGKGARYVTQKLHQRGLKEEIKKMDVDPEAELNRARELALRSLEKTAIKKLTDPWAIKTKLLQKLIAAGFQFDHAKVAIDEALKASKEQE